MRQAGASSVDMDMEAGHALLNLGEPSTIDFPGLADALDGAGYTLKTLKLKAEGKAVAGTCPTHGEVQFVELAKTGQRLEVAGDAPPQLDGPFSGSIQDWTEHPRIELDPGG